jgi:hypothetical protein
VEQRRAIALAGDFWFYAAAQRLPLEAPPPPLLHALQWAFKLAAFALFAWFAVETRRSALPPQRRREHAFALAALLPLFVPAAAWPHYLLLFLVPLSIAAARSVAASRGAELCAARAADRHCSPISGDRPRPLLRPVQTTSGRSAGLYARATLLLALCILLMRTPPASKNRNLTNPLTAATNA